MTKYNHHVNTGITALPQVNWGAHICYFFKDREDLIDVIIPFIKSGLADNEKCILVTSNPLTINEAHQELNKKVTGVDDYIDRGQLLLVDYNAWYIKQWRFDIDTTLQRWTEEEELALNNGYSGLRATGILSHRLLNDWGEIVHYETVIDPVIRRNQIVALCSYAIDNIGIDKVINIVTSHTIVLIKDMDSLVAIGNSRSAKVSIMKNKGLSYTAIGSRLGVTRQRAYQLLNGKEKPKKVKYEMLTISDAASLLGIHINTLRRWSNMGIIQTYRIGLRGDRRFKREDIDNLARSEVLRNNR